MTRLAVALALLAACGSEHAANAVDAADAAPLPDAGPALAIGASQGTITLPFDVTATGSAAAPLGNAMFTHDVGSLEVDGVSGAAFTYATTPFSGYTLYQGFSVAATRWDVFWLYCEGNQVVDIYDEGVAGDPLFQEAADGMCSGTANQISATVSLPAFTIATPAARATGLRVAGSAITVNADGTGTLVVAGATLPLTVFGLVDCSTQCGNPGWYELHSIVRDDAHGALIFVIVYLITGETTSVQLAYARSLPDLGDPIGTMTIPATWSGTAMAVAPLKHPLMPPPRLR